jgi:2-oxoglutarate ferredoxin oxidoreductase subunit delta
MPPRGRIEVSEQFCKGCELCLTVCVPGVLALDGERLTPKGYHPATLVRAGCTGCGLCAMICPEAAIAVYRVRAAEAVV